MLRASQHDQELCSAVQAKAEGQRPAAASSPAARRHTASPSNRPRPCHDDPCRIQLPSSRFHLLNTPPSLPPPPSAVFTGTIVGIITTPLPLGAVAILGLGAAMLTKVLTFAEAFSAFASEIP